MARSNEVRVDAPRFVQLTASRHVQEVAHEVRITQSVLAVRGQRLASRWAAQAVRQRWAAIQSANEQGPALADGRTLPQGATADLSPAVDAVDRAAALNAGRAFSRRLRARVISQTATSEALAKQLTHTGFPIALEEAHGLIEARAPGMPQQVSAQVVRPLRKARLVLVKSVDRRQAKPGDVLTFTIQYHNIGDDAIAHVLIVDSLAERLVYVPDSATSSRKANIEIKRNPLGKAEIYWHLDGQVAPDEFGTVTFKAKVMSF